MRIDHPTKYEACQLPGLWELAFGDPPEFIRLFFETGYAPSRCLCASDNGTVAAAAYWLDCQWQEGKLAYIYAVATHPQYRRRGLCRLLMEKIRECLTAQGYSGAILVPAEDGLREMYGKMGYAPATCVEELTCVPGTAVPLREISAEEFALFRREFLPEKGVIQEGPGLLYLASFARFWRGEDFLLAAAIEDGQLTGLELLGNSQAAPGILAFLNCSAGTFRIPGRRIPFAMFLPLAPGAEAPGYFGLALD